MPLGVVPRSAAFLLLGLLSYVTARWRDWLVNSHTVQAALHDIGLGVGSCLINPDAEAKAAVYDLYRYLNAIHALLYQSVVPHLPQKPSEMIQLGLLTKGEAEILGQAANKQRDLLLRALPILERFRLRCQRIPIRRPK